MGIRHGRQARWRVVVMWLLSVLAWACQRTPEEPPIAKLGNSQLMREELRRSLSYQTVEDSITQAMMYLEDWLATTALYEQALKEGIGNDTLTQLLVEKARRKIIAQRFFERKLQEEIEKGRLRIDSAEAQAFYAANQGLLRFREPHYRVLRIYAATQEAMLSLRQKAMNAAPDAELFAFADSLSPQTCERNQMFRQRDQSAYPMRLLQLESEALMQLVMRMRPKDITPVVKLQDSLFVVLRLEEKFEAGTPIPFEYAYPEISERLRRQKEKAFFRYLVRTSKSALESEK